MTPEDAAEATAAAIATLGSHFMLDGATYARGAELGFEGMDFYVVGRGGALGPVDADVVSAGFVFFNPGAVRAVWENGCRILAPLEAAREFAACAAAWGRAHLPDDLDAARLAELGAKVVAGASPSATPLFAAWRAMEVPSDPKAAALHQMNVLRELRGGLHGVAVLASGLDPLEAVMVKAPGMAPLFGWLEPYPAADPHRPLWADAEALTNRLMAVPLAILDDDERDEFVALADEAHFGTLNEA